MSSEPTWVDDGRPCLLTPVENVKPGDTLLPWAGEPWSWDVVAVAREIGQWERVTYILTLSDTSVIRRQAGDILRMAI